MKLVILSSVILVVLFEYGQAKKVQCKINTRIENTRCKLALDLDDFKRSKAKCRGPAFAVRNLNLQSDKTCQEVTFVLSMTFDGRKQATFDNQSIAGDGARGEKGAKGDKGAMGASGSKGSKGDMGMKGDMGATGPQGPVGQAGAKGDQGTSGSNGSKGDMGMKGENGATGPQGPVGPSGAKGDQGASGSKGSKGDMGMKGDKGATGPQGPVGSSGVKGDQGATGSKGQKGTQGDRGYSGAAGARGSQGSRGLQGYRGPSGFSAQAPACSYRYKWTTLNAIITYESLRTSGSGTMSISTGKFRATRQGVYKISFTTTARLEAGQRVYVSIYKNGVDQGGYAELHLNKEGSGTGEYRQGAIITAFTLNNGDYLWAQTYHLASHLTGQLYQNTFCVALTSSGASADVLEPAEEDFPPSILELVDGIRGNSTETTEEVSAEN